MLNCIKNSSNISRVFEWQSNPAKDIREVIKLQKNTAKSDFEKRTNEITAALNMQVSSLAIFVISI